MQSYNLRRAPFDTSQWLIVAYIELTWLDWHCNHTLHAICTYQQQYQLTTLGSDQSSAGCSSDNQKGILWQHILRQLEVWQLGPVLMPNFSWAEPNTLASESIRNACFNLEQLSCSFHLGHLRIFPLKQLWNGFDSDTKLFMYRA